MPTECRQEPTRTDRQSRRTPTNADDKNKPPLGGVLCRQMCPDKNPAVGVSGAGISVFKVNTQIYEVVRLENWAMDRGDTQMVVLRALCLECSKPFELIKPMPVDVTSLSWGCIEHRRTGKAGHRKYAMLRVSGVSA